MALAATESGDPKPSLEIPAQAAGLSAEGKPTNGDVSDTEASSASIDANLQTISLKDAGMSSMVEMRGPHSYFTLHFTLSHQLVPKQGTLNLYYIIDPKLDPQSTSLQISLNGTAVTTLRPGQNPDSASGPAIAKIPISNLLLVRNNTLTFEFIGSGIMEREAQARQHILCRLFPTSTLAVTGDWLRLGNDLSRLPLPLLDSELQSATTIPFVFLSQPTPAALEAAGVVASWFGLMSGSQPPRFSVALANIPAGNAVILATDRSMLPANLQIPNGSGPVLALRDNPADPYGSLLILAGNNESELLAVARTLSLIRAVRPGDATLASALTGDTAESPALIMPPVRTKDDAPRWLPIKKGALLTSCPTEGSLQTDGSSPIPVYFHVPPDLFYGEKQNLDLHLNYRYDSRLVAPGSALRVVVNGRLISEVPLPPGVGEVDRQRSILVPVAAIRPFGNTLLFNFDFVPANRDSNTSPVLSGGIFCSSSLDLNGVSPWTRMPNLELFADAGFPFTQFADLSQTVVVLPAVPSAEEIALYLHLMRQFGAQTGYPALRVAVTGPSSVISERHDYLILGTMSDQPAFRSLAPLLPATLEETGIHIRPDTGISADIASLRTMYAKWWSRLSGRTITENITSADLSLPHALVGEIVSPVSADRSIVTIALRQDSDAGEFAGTMLDPIRSSGMTNSLTLLRNATFKSYASNVATYHVGNISWYAAMRIYLTRYFLLLLVFVLALSFLLARYAYAWMAWHAHERLKLASVPREED
jgi:cellulose synthase (UDP-forming)